MKEPQTLQTDTLFSLDNTPGRQFARYLHDEIGNALLGLKLYLELIRDDLADGHTERVPQKIDDGVALISQTIDSVRRLAFSLGQSFPESAEEVTLYSTLQRYADQFTERTGIQVEFHIDVPAHLPSIYETTLHRILQGTLASVAAHSKAGNVEVHGGLENGQLWMAVSASGKGFDIRKALSDPRQAFGLIRHRVELLGGNLLVGKQGSGARIEVRIPLEERKAA